jgi:hypothetical protein
MFSNALCKSMARAVILAAGFAVCGFAGTAAAAGSGSETAAVAGQALRIEVATVCEQGNTIFKIKNTGDTWPKTSTFAIYRLGKGDGQVIAQRRMRLNEGQQASFKIAAKRNPTGQLGLMVQPGWYQRDAIYDATAACR